MDKDTEQTLVIFRWWENDVIAIFPEELGDPDPYTCSSYMHFGQHASCDPDMIVKNSRPATEAEYQDLKKELETQIGYNLKHTGYYSRSFLGVRQNKLLDFYEKKHESESNG